MSTPRCSPAARAGERNFSRHAALFKALADPHRLTILTMLANGEVCVCDFTAALPLNQPAVSHHLKLLREAELVTCERRGTWVYYQLAGDARARLVRALDVFLPS